MSAAPSPSSVLVQLALDAASLPSAAALVERVHERLRTLYPCARVTIIVNHQLQDDRVSVVGVQPEAEIDAIRRIVAETRDGLGEGP